MRVRDSDGFRSGSRDSLAGRRQHLAAAALLGALALLGAACTSAARGHSAHPKRAEAPVTRLTITPAGGTRNAKPNHGVTVMASHGRIENVTVTGGHYPVTGYFNPAHTVWHTRWALHPSRSYTVTATAAGESHTTVRQAASFRTLTPAATVSVQTLLGYGQTYGVGIPIMLKFSQPVTHRAAVERSLQVFSSKPVVGGWSWDGNEAVSFRPRTYWPQHTKVSFVAHLNGVQVARGVYGTANLSQSFRIGNSLIAVVNTASHHAHIYYRNKLFGVWPVSTGAPGDDTANGTYLTIEKGNPVLMSGPGYTNFPVPYSVRFTWSGNFMHDAYWSVAEQGFMNVSHGCVNMSPGHARIYYNLAVPGDPVTVTRSPVAGLWDDGWTQWFLTWPQWLRGSATHQAVRAGPAGSTFVDPATLPAVAATAPLHTSRPHNSRAR